MFNRILNVLGYTSLTIMFPLLFLGLAGLPTNIAKADTQIGPCIDGTTLLPPVGGGQAVCCTPENVVVIDGVSMCATLLCNLNTVICMLQQVTSPPCASNPCNGGIFSGCACGINTFTLACICY